MSVRRDHAVLFLYYILQLKAVLQADGAVKHQLSGRGVFVIHTEISLAHELEERGGLYFGQSRLHLGVGQHLQGVGVQAVQEVLVPGVRLGVAEQIVVQAHLGVHGGGGVHPVDGSPLYLAAVRRVAAAAVGIVLTQDLGDIALLILDAAGAPDQIRALQAALGTVGVQPLVLGNRRLQEVLGFYIQIAGESDLAGAVLRAVGVIPVCLLYTSRCV